MSVKNILKIPEDEEFLRSVMPQADNVGKYERRVAKDMIDTMMHYPNCAGMSSTQIGEPTRIIIISRETKTAIINPVVTAESINHKAVTEGCFSLEDWWTVDRPISVTFEGLDLNGNPVKYKSGEFFESWYRYGQHELDHLNGVLISDIGVINPFLPRQNRQSSRYAV